MTDGALIAADLFFLVLVPVVRAVFAGTLPLIILVLSFIAFIAVALAVVFLGQSHLSRNSKAHNARMRIW